MRQGLFFSKCDGLLSQTLDIDLLAKEYGHLASVRVFEGFYNLADFDALLAEVEAKRLDSLVLAGDSPISYRQARNGEQLFRSLAQRGIDPSRIEAVNLRNMVVGPHKASRAALQQKAKLMVDVGLEKARIAESVETLEIPPRQAVAVVGAGTGSIVVAQHLLDEGHKVYLVQEAYGIDIPAEDRGHVRATLAYVVHHPRFAVYDGAAILDFYGYPGDYTLTVRAHEKEMRLQIGAVVLATSRGSREFLKRLHEVFHIDLDEQGRLAARDDVSARALTQDDGVFVIHPETTETPSLAGEMLAADSAAAMTINLLSKKEIYHRVAVSLVREELCGGCGACVKTCMFHAVSLQGNPGISVIDPRRCRGCGNCVTACPAGARDLAVCPTSYLFTAVDILSRFQLAGPGGKVLAIACDGCGYRCLDHAAAEGASWPVGVLPLWVVCGGQIDTQLVMHAFVKGFDGVALLSCGEGCCHNLVGNVDLERRTNLLREVLTSRGVDHSRVQILPTCSRYAPECVTKLLDFCSKLEAKATAGETALLV